MAVKFLSFNSSSKVWYTELPLIMVSSFLLCIALKACLKSLTGDFLREYPFLISESFKSFVGDYWVLFYLKVSKDVIGTSKQSPGFLSTAARLAVDSYIESYILNPAFDPLNMPKLRLAPPISPNCGLGTPEGNFG